MKILRLAFVRLADALGVLFLVALLTFFLLGRAPGEFLDELATNPQISAETLAGLRVQYGLDAPFYIKFWRWLSAAATGDLGYSYVYQRPIAGLIGERIGNTVALNGLALLLAWSIGIALGTAAAAARGSPLDWLLAGATTLLVSTPVLVFSLVLLSLAPGLGLPVGGMTGSDYDTLAWPARLLDRARHLALPLAAATSVLLPSIARHTRTAVVAALGEPWIVTARAKGLGRVRLLLHHALRNALNPLTTLFGYSVSALLSASLLVEVVMGWPGIGQLTVDAVMKRDLWLVVNLAVLSAALLLVGNLAGDLLLRLADPRTAEP